MKVHHIGYLVKDIEKAMEAFQKIGYVISRPSVYDSARGGDICFLRNEEAVVELIAPRKDCKLFSSLAKRIGNAPYHICYIAEDFQGDMERLQADGWMMIQPPQEAVAIDGKKVAFFFHEEIGMMELVEP